MNGGSDLRYVCSHVPYEEGTAKELRIEPSKHIYERFGIFCSILKSDLRIYDLDIYIYRCILLLLLTIKYHYYDH